MTERRGHDPDDPRASPRPDDPAPPPQQGANPVFDESVSTKPDGSSSPPPCPPEDQPTRKSASPLSSPEIEIPFRLMGRPRPGQILFNRYRVIKPLGEGGMGSVWLVRNLQQDVDRALKLIVSEIAGDPQVRARFQREARVMSRLRHRNAVAIHKALLGDDAAFIEMEFVQGKPLQTRLEGLPLPIDFVSNLLEQLCGVLQAAHNLGIVHRDLKPSNLMILDQTNSGREVLKVLDFGIAKILRHEGDETDDVKTQANIFLGTPHYSSPEQIRGAEIDVLSDLYSVGVILYEMLVGRRPFGGSAQQLIRDHLASPPPAFAEKNPRNEVPGSIERVVMKCLAKEPTSRPRSALELIEEFRYAMAHPDAPMRHVPFVSSEPRAGVAPQAIMTPVSRTTTPVASLASQPAKRRSRLVPFGVIALILGVSGGGVWWFATHRGTRGQDTPEVPSSSRPGVAYQLDVEARRQVVSWAKEGFEPVDAEGSEGGWPRVLRRRDPLSGQTFSYAISPTGHYLPEGYQAEGDALASDGWPAAILRKGDGTRFLRIEGGRFLMGSPDKADDDERPVHEVRLSGFYLQQNEVTNAEMSRHVATLPAKEKPAGWLDRARFREKAGISESVAGIHPAMAVSHPDAERFAAVYAGGMLPTEAQWEFTARSRSSDVYPYVWSGNPAIKDESKLRELSHVLGASEGPLPTRPVGSFPRSDATRQGVLDLNGNVREWCRDLWGPYVQTQPPPRDPCNRTSLVEGSDFVVRGGGYSSLDARSLRVTSRDRAKASQEESDIGFRVVLETPDSPGSSWNRK